MNVLPPISFVAALVAAACIAPVARGLDYAYATPEPQKTGWPLSAAEEAYVQKPEHERRPGAEVMQPIAAPVVGGMLSSLVHILIVTPVIFYWLHGRKLAPPAAAPVGGGLQG